MILNSLEEPVVPFSNYVACVELGSRPVGARSAIDVTAALRGAPAVSVNTLVYVSSFLGQLKGVDWDADVPSSSVAEMQSKEVANSIGSRLCNTFGPVLLSPPKSHTAYTEALRVGPVASTIDWNERSNFLRHLIHASRKAIRVTVAL
jgi:hypothetical protein